METLLSKHTSKPRNPKMAQVFYRAGFIEAWGRGYEKIMKAFDKANLKRPEFTVEQGGVTATIYREIFMSVRGDSKSNQTEPKPNQNRTEKHNLQQRKLFVEINVRNLRLEAVKLRTIICVF